MKPVDPDKRAIRHAFGKAAASYDSVAAVQARIVTQLLEYCPPTAAGTILDAGCGTGRGAEGLAALYPGSTILGLDAALGMCQAMHSAKVMCADIEALPLRADSLNLYWSSLAWQWTEPRIAARESFRVLRQGGEFRVATLGPRTMFELREVFGGIDDHPHVRSFDPPEYCEEALQLAGFTDIRVAGSCECGYFPDLATLMRSIRRLGAHVLDKRRPTLMGRQAWMQLSAAYENFRTCEGLPVSHDVIYLCARKE